MNQDPEGALAIFKAVADLKITVGLDNFGAGLASKQYMCTYELQ